MPFYYDVNYAFTTNGTLNTESTHMYAKTVANQESAKITGIYPNARMSTAGGAQLRVKTNTGTSASGGTASTPAAKYARPAFAAQTTFFNDGTAITVGGTLVKRLTIGFAQTGGMGGWVPPEPAGAFAMSPNATNPVDIEFVSIASAASVPGDLTIEFSEG